MLNNQAVQAVDTGSQVCNLVWSVSVNELVSTHGYSQNQVAVWSYPTMTQIATLTVRRHPTTSERSARVANALGFDL